MYNSTTCCFTMLRCERQKNHQSIRKFKIPTTVLKCQVQTMKKVVYFSYKSQSRVCSYAEQTDAAARKSRQRDYADKLTMPAGLRLLQRHHGNPFQARSCHRYSIEPSNFITRLAQQFNKLSLNIAKSTQCSVPLCAMRLFLRSQLVDVAPRSGSHTLLGCMLALHFVHSTFQRSCLNQAPVHHLR